MDLLTLTILLGIIVGLRTFPGKSLSRKDDSQKDVSRIVIFPERRFPDRTFPGQSLSRKDDSRKDVSRKIIFPEK